VAAVTDDDLVQAYLDGDLRAFETLFDRYEQRLLGFLVSLGGKANLRHQGDESMSLKTQNTIMPLGNLALLTFILALPLASTWAQGEESEDVMRELKERRHESKQAYTEEVQAFIQRELPQGIALLKSATALAERRGARLESQFRLAETGLILAEARRELGESQQHYPQEYDRIKQDFGLEIRMRLVANRFRLSDDEKERERLAQELGEVLDQSFDRVHAMLERESREAGPNYTPMRRRVRDRARYRAEIIQRRKSELLHDYDPYSWR